MTPSPIDRAAAAQLPEVGRPALAVPAGACDCHCHVFGPYAQFPLAAEHTYLPPETSAQDYLNMLDRLGFSRGVLVQPSAHGLDNRALLHALAAGAERLRGVAVVSEDADRSTLEALYAAGVRGLRFSRLLDDAGVPRYKNAVDISALPRLLPAMQELGLHAQLWTGADQLGELAPLIRSTPIPFVIDHIGRPDPERALSDALHRPLWALVEEGHLWVKLTPYRPSLRYPDYEDIRPFHQRLVELNPDRLVWGSDWPHINMPSNMPRADHLLELLGSWTSERSVLEKILVANPAALYGF
ncbi:amidohydrolase family protein [Verticiella sediminum]|nr:amidohydrolase family protein [Verticiella sediminum]